MKMPWGAVLKDAFKNLFKKPATVNYPLESLEPPERLRGKLEFDESKCLGCGNCARVCPTYAIEIVPSEITKLKKKPQITIAKCVFCGSCVDICPVNALYFTTDYHISAFTKEELKIG